MNYQAVIRNSSNQLVANTQIGMQISILEGNANGTPVYEETHNPTTNQNGLVSIHIGDGSILTGHIDSINWSSNSFFIKTETDINGGSNYTISGTSQMVTVPYAMHAKTAESVNKPVLMEPYILGRSQHLDNGSWNYANKKGWQGANAACKAAYPNEPYARALTAEEITRAITQENYSDTTNYNAVDFWVISSSVVNTVNYNGSGLNNAGNLSGHYGGSTRGLRGRINFDYAVPGYGVSIPRYFNIQSSIDPGNYYPCLCGTYKPAD
jgi:hypothetical protein